MWTTMDRNRCRELDVLLVMAEHPPDLVHDEQDIQFPAPIPVHLTYQTAYVDDDGQLVIRPDVYGLDSRVLALIKTERSMIDVASKERDRDAANVTAAAARRSMKQPEPQGGGGVFQA